MNRIRWAVAQTRRAVPPGLSEAETLDLQADLHLAARSPVNVMLTASNGTKRALWARTLHDCSPRRGGPFVAVCAEAIPTGDCAVSGADVDDWFDRAAGGTLFVDRVGDLSPHAQARLLARLIEQSRSGNGAATPRRDRHVRVIAGSHRSFRTDLAAGTFSHVLFYQLNVIHIDRLHHHEPAVEAMKAQDITWRNPAGLSRRPGAMK